MAGRKRKKTIKLPELAGIRKLLGIEKAKRTRHSRAVHKRATALRHGAHDSYEMYQERRPVAKAAARIAKRESGGSTYEYHKIYRRALANPELYMDAYGLTQSGRKRRRKK